MAAYTSTQSGNFNDAATWGGGGWPNSNGDTYTVSSGHTVTVNGDFSGTDLGVSTVNGLLTSSTNANTALQHSAAITIGATGEIRMGNSGSPVGAAYTAQLLFNPAADNTTMIALVSGGKLTANGTATWNLQSEAWVSCYSTLSAQALSGQANLSVPAAFANALRASGDILLIQGTSSYNQCEVVTVQSKSGGTITLTGNLTNTHDAGAYVVPLNRNVIIKNLDSAKQSIIDDNTNSPTAPGVDIKLCELENIKFLDCLTLAAIDYCAIHGSNSYGLVVRDGTNMTLTNSVLADTYYWGTWTNGKAANLILGKAGYATGAIYTGSGPLTLDTGMMFGANYGARANSGPIVFKNFDIRNTSIIGYFMYAELRLEDCTLEDVSYLTSYQRGHAFLRNVTEPSTAMMANAAKGVKVQSQDHNRTLGAAKTWVNDIGTIERQNTVARSGYAAECTPDTGCSSNHPLEIEWDIPCTHGDVLTVTVYVRVNSTYGTSNDPLFILDPDSMYGCNDTATEDITAADTWTQLSVTGTANLGGGGVKGVVNCVLRIPHYVSGGKVYVDDFEVTIT